MEVPGAETVVFASLAGITTGISEPVVAAFCKVASVRVSDPVSLESLELLQETSMNGTITMDNNNFFIAIYSLDQRYNNKFTNHGFNKKLEIGNPNSMVT